MAWDLLETTGTGWKKYLDNFGNNRYQRPDGKFANRYQWAGATSTSDPEPVPEEPEPPIDGPPILGLRLSDFIKEKGEYPSYSKADDYILKEPARDIDIILEYSRPPKMTIYEYVRVCQDHRLDDLMRFVTQLFPDYEYMSIGFKVELRDENMSLISTSYIHTPLLQEGTELQMRTDFNQKLEMAVENAEQYYEMFVIESRILGRVMK